MDDPQHVRSVRDGEADEIDGQHQKSPMRRGLLLNCNASTVRRVLDFAEITFLECPSTRAGDRLISKRRYLLVPAGGPRKRKVSPLPAVACLRPPSLRLCPDVEIRPSPRTDQTHRLPRPRCPARLSEELRPIHLLPTWSTL